MEEAPVCAGRLKFGRGVADSGRMIAAITQLAAAGNDTQPEPAWSVAAFEALTEEAATGLLLRRFRKLIALGYDPDRALINATRVEIALR
jgi:hypothetical protein